VVLDGAFVRAAAVFGGARSGQMPSHEATAGDQRHIVEIVDVESEVELGAARLWHEGHGILRYVTEGRRSTARSVLLVAWLERE
jgi:hypothetical protein